MSLLLLFSTFFTFVELNCENLFDCNHDSLKNDTEFLPDGSYRWTRTRYWRKLNHIGQAVLACGDGQDGWQLPDMVALCEVENDTVMRDLTRRSLLRSARYEYVMTDSPDERGIDVALMYSPFSFAMINHRTVRISPPDGMRPTRDLLYVCGMTADGDTLHVIVTHMPSRRSGVRVTDRYRDIVARSVVALADSVRLLSPDAPVIVAGLVLFPAAYAAALTAMDEVHESYGALSRAYGIKRTRQAFRMYLPLSAPSVLGQAGAILSMGLKIAVSGEVLSSTAKSLGGMMQEAKLFLEMPRLLALTLAAVLLGFLLEGLCALVANLCVRWRR